MTTRIRLKLLKVNTFFKRMLVHNQCGCERLNSKPVILSVGQACKTIL